MSSPPPKRNYICRKKYLNESVKEIKEVLEFIRLSGKDSGSPESSEQTALVYAKSIEAFCWLPHSHISPVDYQKIMKAKTQELCRMLLHNTLPTVDFGQLRHLDPQSEKSQKSGKLPLPIFSKQPNPQESGLEFELPSFETESMISFESELRDAQAAMNSFERTLMDEDAFL
jgi:hypothetical protein